MRRIILKSPVVIKSCPHAQIGVPIDVPDHDAAVLLGMGVADLVGPEEKPDGLTTGRGVIEAREPEIATREPEPATETPPQKPSRRKPAT